MMFFFRMYHPPSRALFREVPVLPPPTKHLQRVMCICVEGGLTQKEDTMRSIGPTTHSLIYDAELHEVEN